jgi:nucleotide-binding universal stress UspA family protein
VRSLSRNGSLEATVDDQDEAMDMSKRDPGIVLATTGESREAAAVRFVAAEALQTEQPVTVVHVVHGTTRVSQHHPLAYSSAKVEEQGRRIVARVARELRDLTNGTVEVRCETPRGGTVNHLVDVSAHAKMVVLQRRDLPRAARVLSLSTTARVAGRSLAPVASVPSSWGVDQLFVRRVVVAVGERERPSNLLGHAFELADQHDVGLTVLRVTGPPAAAGGESEQQLRYRREQLITELDKAVRAVRTGYPGVRSDIEVLEGRPVDTLLRAPGPSDLLVVGRREVVSPAYERLGTVSGRVLRACRCPVLVVPRPFADFVPRRSPEVSRHPGRASL